VRIVTLRKLTTAFGYAFAIIFGGGLALWLLADILWEPLLGTPFRYGGEIAKVILYVGLPLLVPAACASFFG